MGVYTKFKENLYQQYQHFTINLFFHPPMPLKPIYTELTVANPESASKSFPINNIFELVREQKLVVIKDATDDRNAILTKQLAYQATFDPGVGLVVRFECKKLLLNKKISETDSAFRIILSQYSGDEFDALDKSKLIEVLKEKNKEGKLLIILDGFDEDNFFHPVIKRLSQMDCVIVTTSPDSMFAKRLHTGISLEVSGLSNREAQQNFLNQYWKHAHSLPELENERLMLSLESNPYLLKACQNIQNIEFFCEFQLRKIMEFGWKEEYDLNLTAVYDDMTVEMCRVYLMTGLSNERDKIPILSLVKSEILKNCKTLLRFLDFAAFHVESRSKKSFTIEALRKECPSHVPEDHEAQKMIQVLLSMGMVVPENDGMAFVNNKIQSFFAARYFVLFLENAMKEIHDSYPPINVLHTWLLDRLAHPDRHLIGFFIMGLSDKIKEEFLSMFIMSLADKKLSEIIGLGIALESFVSTLQQMQDPASKEMTRIYNIFAQNISKICEFALKVIDKGADKIDPILLFLEAIKDSNWFCKTPEFKEWIKTEYAAGKFQKETIDKFLIQIEQEALKQEVLPPAEVAQPETAAVPVQTWLPNWSARNTQLAVGAAIGVGIACALLRK